MNAHITVFIDCSDRTITKKQFKMETLFNNILRNAMIALPNCNFEISEEAKEKFISFKFNCGHVYEINYFKEIDAYWITLNIHGFDVGYTKKDTLDYWNTVKSFNQTKAVVLYSLSTTFNCNVLKIHYSSDFNIKIGAEQHQEEYLKTLNILNKYIPYDAITSLHSIEEAITATNYSMLMKNIGGLFL